MWPSVVLLAACAVAGCGYDPPLVPAGAVIQNTIRGIIVARGVTEGANTAVFVFDADNPPPPRGTGRPLTFTMVPAEAFEASISGELAAPFSVPYLPDANEEGGYPSGFLVSVLMDVDQDFSTPWATAMSGSTCGDMVGITPAPVFVEGGAVLDGVTVTIDRAQPIERPAFTYADPAKPPAISKTKGANSALSRDPAASNVQTYGLQSTSIHTVFLPREKGDFLDVPYDLEGPCPLDAGTDVNGNEVQAGSCLGLGGCRCDVPELTIEPCQTAFNVVFVDECDNSLIDGEAWDGVVATRDELDCGEPDGKLDPHPGEVQAINGLSNVFPRIFIELVADPDGNPLELGTYPYRGRDLPERWVGENFVLAYELNFSTPPFLGLGIPDDIYVDLDGDGTPDPSSVYNTPVPLNKIKATWSPVVRHYHAGGKFEDLANGTYDLLDLRCNRDDQGNFPVDVPYCEETGEVAVGDIPPGRWKMTLITHTGQSWAVPNESGSAELADAIGLDPLESTDEAFDVTNQGVYLTTTD